MRQKDQTKKAPTGTFQRENLVAHLEKQAKEHPDKEDLVPFTGEKRGRTLCCADPQPGLGSVLFQFSQDSNLKSNLKFHVSSLRSVVGAQFHFGSYSR